jgi:hypothetical protein
MKKNTQNPPSLASYGAAKKSARYKSGRVGGTIATKNKKQNYIFLLGSGHWLKT